MPMTWRFHRGESLRAEADSAVLDPGGESGVGACFSRNGDLQLSVSD